MRSFNELKKEAQEAIFKGWDFSFLKNRFIEDAASWDYRTIITKYIKKSETLLDMGTGGGEFLKSLSNMLPAKTYATEQYRPNVPIARENLNDLGIKVFVPESDENLPFEDNSFDLIINRHESYNCKEIKRILKPNGIFITQQVGELDNIEINHFFNNNSRDANNWSLEHAEHELENNNFKIIEKKEELIPAKFIDIGAVIYYLKVIEWQIPNFNMTLHEQELEELHQKIKTENGFKTKQHRFYLIARK